MSQEGYGRFKEGDGNAGSQKSPRVEDREEGV
jgi:hypothetical protein